MGGLSNIALGFGSFMFHAAMTRLWQQIDVGAMYWMMNAALAATLWRWLGYCTQRVPQATFVLSMIVLAVLIADVVMMVLKWKLSAGVVFTSQLCVVIGSEVCLLIVPSVLSCVRHRRRLDSRLALLAGL